MEIIFKVATFLFGAVGATKIYYELTNKGKGQLRDEYRFSKEFLQEVADNPAMHPFLKEKGYQALAGDHRLSAAEVEYLLSLQKPDQVNRPDFRGGWLV
jgi:hypothetical protein